MSNKTKKGIRKINGLGGWLIVALIVLVFYYLSALYLLIEKLGRIILFNAGFGVYVSGFLLLFSCFFLLYSIILILEQKKKAKELTLIALLISLIFSVWYNILGPIIFYSAYKTLLIENFSSFLINFLIFFVLIAYFKKSERVKNTFVK